MCYDDNARAPLPPGTNGSAQGEDLVLQASDGNRFAAYVARPEHSTGAQILIFPDVRGLHQFYKDLALRFAETGTTALAIDYFGRTAGLTERNDAFEFWPHVQQLNIQTSFKDVQAALAYLRQNNSHQPIFTVGFCRGGILNLSSQIRYPVLGLFGGADPGIPSTDVQALDANLDKAGVEHEIVVYPDAPHSFFDRRSADFAEASSDAWRRVLGFIRAHTPA